MVWPDTAALLSRSRRAPAPLAMIIVHACQYQSTRYCYCNTLVHMYITMHKNAPATACSSTCTGAQRGTARRHGHSGGRYSSRPADCSAGTRGYNKHCSARRDARVATQIRVRAARRAPSRRVATRRPRQAHGTVGDSRAVTLTRPAAFIIILCAKRILCSRHARCSNNVRVGRCSDTAVVRLVMVHVILYFCKCCIWRGALARKLDARQQQRQMIRRQLARRQFRRFLR